jgi:hypothetical protein
VLVLNIDFRQDESVCEAKKKALIILSARFVSRSIIAGNGGRHDPVGSRVCQIIHIHRDLCLLHRHLLLRPPLLLRAVSTPQRSPYPRKHGQRPQKPQEEWARAEVEEAACWGEDGMLLPHSADALEEKGKRKREKSSLLICTEFIS